MPELVADFITSLDGYASTEGWPGWWAWNEENSRERPRRSRSLGWLAVAEGFEPSVDLRPQTLSRRSP
jgi:hypothetical protein